MGEHTPLLKSLRLCVLFMVDLTINETLQTGAVENRTYRGQKSTGDESVYSFLEFTIIHYCKNR